MKPKKANRSAFVAVLGITALILDAKTAAIGAQEGITLCLKTVIPSIFPFIVLSSVICSCLLGSNIALLQPITKLCGIPKGAESLFILGCLGGYPVGAKCVSDAYQKGCINKDAAGRMLAFCNNAGPAFIFGMAGQLFARRIIPWLIWLIQILSAIMVGIVIPKKQSSEVQIVNGEPITLVQALGQSIKIMGNICAWIVIFRVLIALLTNWFLVGIPELPQAVIIGTLELANGFVFLQQIGSEPLRFLLCNTILSFGGLCVTMQTAAVSSELDIQQYFPGKALQAVFSIGLSLLTIWIFIGKLQYFAFLLFAGVLVVLICVFSNKNNSRNLYRTDV